MTERRDTVVVSDGGSSVGAVLGVILLVVLVAVAWYFLFGPGHTASPSSINVDLNLPSIAPSLAPAST